MSKTIKVIPSRFWYDASSGRSASLYGAKPYGEDWSVRTRGYTWEVVDHRGRITVGLCRVPAETLAEAERVAAHVAERFGSTVVLPHGLNLHCDDCGQTIAHGDQLPCERCDASVCSDCIERGACGAQLCGACAVEAV